MDRLTIRREKDGVVCPRVRRGTDLEYIARTFTQMVYDRLAEYEDTGLTPEEIMELKYRKRKY